MGPAPHDPTMDCWHPVTATADLGAGLVTPLMGVPVRITRTGDGAIVASGDGRELPVIERFGFAWTSLGTPERDLFDIPEAGEPDRRNVSAGPVSVATSAPRAIENFLDMAHFPFVHTDILGAEPHTEVKDYDVDLVDSEDEILATRCRFFQPMAALSAADGMDVDYAYRVPHPYCAVLYKSSGADPSRMDVVAIFGQATSEVTIRAHMFLSMLDTAHTDTEMRRFQQLIFGQDKPILENQLPKRLPLDPRAETPIRADLSSIVYRRWLSARNVRYGVIPAMQGGEGGHMAEAVTWFPIASSSDLPLRHVFHAQLMGREMAVWRADDGTVNVWENRCLHRGVRLTIGTNEGAELKCQYHGWRYASGTASCTYIPAHPANAPARQITNRTYPALERFGLVWTVLDPDRAFEIDWPAGAWSTLRPIPISASADSVAAAIEATFGGKPRPDVHPSAFECAVPSVSPDPLLALVQPQAPGKTVLRCLYPGTADATKPLLARYNAALTAFRNSVEAGAPETAEAEAGAEYDVPQFNSSEAPVPTAGPIKAVVQRKWQAAEGITALTLRAASGRLPSFQPGAHIDLTLPNGLKRQYSLIDGPGTWKSWTIAVKREAVSRGGSHYVADTLVEGDEVEVSEPRNTFPLRRDAKETLFIAGGIGITPLLAMARALAAGGNRFALHVFARSDRHLPFAEELSELAPAVTTHIGFDNDQTRQSISQVLGDYAPGRQVYTCGPSAMIDTVLAVAEEQGWPDEVIHFEHFSNDHDVDTSSEFDVELARSALSVRVRAGTSILSALREEGVDVPSACERGACGTCVATVIEGMPDHQDAYLSKGERAANTRIVTCVSRSKTPRLVLDL